MHDGHFIEGGSKEKVFRHPTHPITRTLIPGHNTSVIKNGVVTELSSNTSNDGTISIEPGHWILADDSEITHP